MDKNFTIKKSQEDIYINNLIDTWLINKEIINLAKNEYFDNPYHNFLHALRVANYVLLLPYDKFDFIEMRSLIIAALFHDAWHTWVVDILDEFKSLSIFREKMDIYLESDSDFVYDDGICRNAIIWTVFKNRAKNTNKYAKILADLDIGDLWFDIGDFIYFWSLLAYEFNQEAIDFYEKSEKWYFKYLMSINKYIIIDEDVRQILPNSLNNIKKFYQIPIEKKLEMFQVLKEEDITLENFKNRFCDYF